MANPSLQIGNNKWGIKEDNLLGYNTVGTNFLPIETTMTRASAGTRVNPQGLVETVELLGSELVTNGDFDNGATDWTITAGATITDVATISTTGSMVYISSDTANLVNGKSYKITLTATRLTGTGLLAFTDNLGNNITGTPLLDSDGELTYYFTAQADITGFGFKRHNSGTYSWELDNISVKEETRNDLARVDYTDGTSSLLAEPQRTNLVTYSEDFTSWNQIQSITLTANSTISPSGDNNGTKFLSTNNNSKVRATFSVVSGTTYTFSVYCKNIDATIIRLLGYDGANSFTNTVTSEVNTSTWTKVSLIFTAANTSPSGQVQIARDLPNGESLFFWGAQLEESSYATSYIPTSGSTVTRVQDQYEKTGISNKINSTEGVLFVELENITGTDATNKMISITDSSTTNKISLFVSSNQISVESSGSGTNLGIYSKALQSGFNKIAIKFKVNDCALWVNGTEYTDTSFAAFSSSTLNALVFDRGDGTQDFFGKVKQIQVYKTALTNAELITLTTI